MKLPRTVILSEGFSPSRRTRPSSYHRCSRREFQPMYDGFWTYIVSSRSGTLYIGVTNYIQRRIREHKSGAFEGFGSKYHCNRLVYYEKYDDIRNAIDREKQLKRWVRLKKIALI